MSRRYIEGQEAKITINDKLFVDVEFYDGEKFEMLEPKRLFPTSGVTKYITLLDLDGNEKAIIRNIDTLLPESKEAVETCLNEHYLIPKLKRFIERSEKFQIWMWTWETDNGIVSFEIINHIASIKLLYDGRVLIKDGNDNRYEIPNIYELDKRSFKMIMPDI